ncbi:MAG: hypothetical protein QXM31_03695 [Candidatus Woesearchaeota archaeon]
MAKAICKCTPGGFVWMVIGVIVMALGVWAFVNGLRMQWSGSLEWIKVSFWYALGLLVVCIGKMIKIKGCSSCPVHGL